MPSLTSHDEGRVAPPAARLLAGLYVTRALWWFCGIWLLMGWLTVPVAIPLWITLTAGLLATLCFTQITDTAVDDLIEFIKRF